jgi:hypothetical protein
MQGLGVSHSESDATGDHGYAATYVVTETALTRSVDGEETVALRC